MGRIDSSLVQAIERFPEHWGQIRWLAHIDEKFGDLCRDYADAIASYHYWKQRSQTQSLDYATIVAELEAEILREITASVRLKIQR